MTDIPHIVWAAGFFDADGTVSISYKSGGYLHVNVAITQRDPLPLEKFVELFGGYIRTQTGHQAGYFRWRPDSKEDFLRVVFPYLVLKHERVRRLLLKYYDLTQPGNKRVTADVKHMRLALARWFQTQTGSRQGKPSIGKEVMYDDYLSGNEKVNSS